MENVRIGILTAYDEVCAFADNNVDNALHYYNDELVEYLKGSASTYTFSANAKHPDSEFLVEGNKIAFRRKEKDYYMNVMHVERNENEVTVEAYSLSFELLNEQRSAYKASSAMSFEQYLAVFDPEHVVTLGINEVSGRSITHEWEGEDTILARLFSLATVFSAELEFLPELNDDYSLKRIVMNVYNEHSDTNQGVGQNRDDIILRYGKDISGITKTSDITELYTAITPTGTDGLTVASLDKTEYDADGNVEYISPLHNPHIYAVQARDRFPSNLMANENERYIGVNWEYDTSNVNTLYGQALAQLKKNCVPKISYTVEDYFDTGIGDTVTIADESFLPILYLSARVTEQHISFTDPSQNKTTFDNFKELQSQIDESLLSRVQELIAQNRTYTAMISTDNGIVFRNGIGSTAMTAHIRDAGGIELSENYEIHWYKDGEEVYIGNPYTISADDVDGKAVYRFDAVDTSGKVTAFYEVTVSDVNDGQDGEDGEPGPEGPVGPIGPPGADGKSLYTWIKYADSPTTGMSDTPDGKQYMGIAYNKTTPTESNDYSDYAWSLITGEGVPGAPGEDGKTLYTWVRYADNAQGEGISNDPTGKNYIGLAYNKETPTESNSPSDYAWSLFRGPQGIPGEDGKSSYIYIRYSAVSNPTSSSQISTTPNKYIGIQVSQNPVASTSPEDYTWAQFTGDPGATGARGPAGPDGKTPYIHFAYANSADGRTDFSTTTSAGRSYMGQYADYTETDSTDPSKYTWIKVKGENGADGEDGKPTGITVSSTEPENPYTGMLWKHTGTVPGLVQNATYRWNGSSWELYLFVAENLEVDSLSALSANLGHVTAGSIVIPWSISDNPQFNVDGTTEFSNAEGGGNPLVMNYTQKNKQDGNVEANGYTRYGYDGVTIQVTLPNGITREVQLTYTSLMMRDDDGYAVMEKSDLEKFFTGVYPGGNFTGNINTLLDPGTYYCNFSNIQNAAFSTGYGWCLNLKSSDTSRLQQLFRYSSEGIDSVAIRYYINSQWYPWRWIPVNNAGRWTAIPLTSGYVTSERRAPQYRVSAGRVEFRGQVERSDGAVLNGTLGTLPSDVRPATSKIFQQADDSHGGCRVAITTDGQIQSRTINDSKYVSLDGIFYYL